MSAPRFADCRCGHNKMSHEVEDAPWCCHKDCGCGAYRPAVATARASTMPTRRCGKCKEVKPASEFYEKGDGQRQPMCRDCDNVKPRSRTANRIIRVRARHRAVAELTKRHAVEFRELLDWFTKTAFEESARLSTAPAAAETYKQNQTVRLRPGPKREGQGVEDRIDVARCPECVGFHDRGHRCENCGAEPHAVAS